MFSFAPFQGIYLGLPPPLHVPLPSAKPTEAGKIVEAVSVSPPETLSSDSSHVQRLQLLCCHAVIWLL